MASPMSLKNGLVRVRSETPMVTLPPPDGPPDPAPEVPPAGAVAELVPVESRSQPAAATRARARATANETDTNGLLLRMGNDLRGAARGRWRTTDSGAAGGGD